MPISSGPKTELKRCVFVGPTLRDAPLDEGITRFGPAQLGSLYCAAKAGYNVIGLIDGIFGNVPSVWHKEILSAPRSWLLGVWKLKLGRASSSGALSLWHAWSRYAYRLYRAGVITADDEVALLHGDETTNYTCFSEPLINARLTLRYLRRKRLLSAKQEHQAIPRFKALHFSQRTFPVYREILLSDFGACEGMRMLELFKNTTGM